MIKIICVGKIKEKFYRDAIEEYLKRLSKYTKIEIIECKDYSLDNIEEEKEKEKNGIERYISDKDYVISLDIKGNYLTSEEFADKIDKTLISNSNIDFISIGWLVKVQLFVVDEDPLNVGA